jgi:DNA repair protein RadC
MAHAILAPIIEREAQEVFCALLFDGKQRVTAYAEITRGTLTASLVHPREVFGAAVRMGAASVIVAHNHPSGDPEPSAEDLAVTERLRQAGEILGIPLLDHLVIGRDSFVSLRARGVMR